jgi:hypothetical protein
MWLAFAAGLPLARAADGPTPTAELSLEYRAKAGFLFNFAQFVEWPPRVFRDAQAPIVIGLFGDDPFGSYLDEVVQGEKIGDRPLVVQRIRRVEDLGDCQILFISRSATGQLAEIFSRLRDRSVLTVGEDESFERTGGMVRFTIENNKVRLRINRAAAEAHELTISSKLLRLATLVPPPKT